MEKLALGMLWLLAIVAALFAIFVLGWMMYIKQRQFNISDEALSKQRTQLDVNMEIKYIHTGNVSIRYATLGPSDGQPLILLHGAPGSLYTWNTLLHKTNLLETYRIFIPDRPGYGRSDLDDPTLLFGDQSNMLGHIFDDIQRDDAIVVGFSFGGTLLPYMLLQHSDKIAGSIFVGGSTDPDHQTIWWVNYLSRYKVFRFFMPASLNHTNDESLASETQLRSLVSQRSGITTPTVIIHSTDDKIVPYANAEFTASHLTNSPHMLMSDDNVGHFYPYTHPHRIQEAIENLLILMTHHASK